PTRRRLLPRPSGPCAGGDRRSSREAADRPPPPERSSAPFPPPPHPAVGQGRHGFVTRKVAAGAHVLLPGGRKMLISPSGGSHERQRAQDDDRGAGRIRGLWRVAELLQPEPHELRLPGRRVRGVFGGVPLF